MSIPALKFKNPVIFLGPSNSSPSNLTDALTYGEGLIAADSGAEVALAHGIIPTAVIGDFDSFSPKMRNSMDSDRLFHVPEQQSTDFAKCLMRVEAPLVIAVGFSGGRLDHELAVLNALVAYPDQPCIVVGDTDLVFHAPRKLEIDLPVGTRVSLFPMAGVTGVSTGLEWPIDGIDFAPNGMIGTSNRVVGPVTLAFDNPGMLAILPREHLGVLVAALSL